MNADNNSQLQALLVDLATAPHEQQRWEAAPELGRLADRRAVEPLIKALADPSAPVRFEAARALGQLGDGRAARPLIAVLGQSEEAEDVVQAAGLALAELDETALDLLIFTLHNKKATILQRAYVARAIGSIGAVRPSSAPEHNPAKAIPASPQARSNALAALFSASLEDFNWNEVPIRAAIVEGLGLAGDSKNATVVNKLAHVLVDEHEDTTVRCEAAWGLSRLGGPVEHEILLFALERLAQEDGDQLLLHQNLVEALKLWT